MSRQLFLACYDIACPRRAYRVRKVLRSFAFSVQTSIVECALSVAERERLIRDIENLVDPDVDRFLLLHIDPRAFSWTIGASTTSAQRTGLLGIKMTTLIVDQKGATLRVEREVIELILDGKATRLVPIKRVERVILHGDVALGSAALTKLAEAGVAVVCIGHRASRYAVVSGTLHGDAGRRIRQHLVFRDQAVCAELAKELVVAKIAAQARLLSRALHQRPDLRRLLWVASVRLDRLLMTLGTKNALSLASLRGKEGAAAARYFGAFRALFPRQLGLYGTPAAAFARSGQCHLVAGVHDVARRSHQGH